MGSYNSSPPSIKKLHTSPKDFDNELNILTYNIFMRPPGINNDGCCACADAHDDYKIERLQYFGRRKLKRYDIVCLQEMFCYNSKDKINILLKCAQRHHFVSSIHSGLPQSGFKFSDGGLMILSKYLIIESDFYQFKHSNSSDGLAAKGVLYALIELEEGRYIHVFNTHLNATYKGTEKASAKTRRHQISEMRAFMNEKMNDDDFPVVICGDFNVDANGDIDDFHSDEYVDMMDIIKEKKKYRVHDLIYKELEGHPNTYGDVLLDDNDEAVMEFGMPVPVDDVLTDAGYRTVQERLDYILLLEGRKRESVGFKNTKVEPFFVRKPFGQLSDHYGISTTLELE